MRGILALVGIVVVDEVGHEVIGLPRLVIGRRPVPRPPVAFRAVGRSVDGNQVLGIVRQCFAFVLGQLVGTECPPRTEREHVINLDAHGLVFAGSALEVERGPRIRIMDGPGRHLALVVLAVLHIVEVAVENVVASVAAEIIVSRIARRLRGPIAELLDAIVVILAFGVALSNVESLDDLLSGLRVDLADLTGATVLDAQILLERHPLRRVSLRRCRSKECPHRQQGRDGQCRRGSRSRYSHDASLRGDRRLHLSSCGGDACTERPHRTSLSTRTRPGTHSTGARLDRHTHSKSSASPRSRTAMIFLNPLPSERSDLSKPL